MNYLIVSAVSLLVGAGIVGYWTFRIWRKALGFKSERERLDRDSKELALRRASLDDAQSTHEAKAVSYEELRLENDVLKGDIQNIDVMLRKLELDRQEQASRQSELAERSQALGERYLKEVEKWVSKSINANNYAKCKQQLVKTIEWCRSIGYAIGTSKEEELLEELKRDFEKAVRAQLEREEQARIKARIREEQAREREYERLLKQLDREREAIEMALQAALAGAQDEHAAEVERLRDRLREAEASKARAVSQAQLTRSGHIYVISNLGSFGDGVFKIGMTRRLEPLDRIRELGDASVPFGFDVHMMISCEDAPLLERKLHEEFHRERLNRVNPRKEYFRVDLERIREMVLKHHGEVDYVADAEALEYRQTLEMTDQEAEDVEQTYREAQAQLGLTDLDE